MKELIEGVSFAAVFAMFVFGLPWAFYFLTGNYMEF